MRFILRLGLVFLTVTVAVLGPALFDAPEFQANAQVQGNVPGQAHGNLSDSEFWRRLRAGEAVIVSDPKTGPKIMIQSAGEEWRAIRNGLVSRFGGYALAVSIGAVLLFAAIRRRVTIDGGRSGRTIPRFSMAERLTHWMVASLFILLGVSGLILLFGKFAIAPAIGKEAFAALASASLQGHNLFGPLYVFAILAMFALYVRDNLLTKADIMWLLQGGFMFKGHAPSWKYNFGEKAWFWIAVLTGIVLSVSGIVMDFPWLVESRSQLQLANLGHGIAALIAISAAIGHIYLGTVGVEGALEGMTAGTVDENWAREHHDLWAEQVIAKRADAPAE